MGTITKRIDRAFARLCVWLAGDGDVDGTRLRRMAALLVLFLLLGWSAFTVFAL